MPVRLQRADGVLTLSLNRPERLNAIDEAMATLLLDALREADRDDDVRCLVLRGNGRAFCSGRDVTTPETREILELVQAVSLAMVECRKPIVFAVHGWVVGAGLEWMLDGDVTIAARGTRFRLPEIEIGVFPTGGITAMLPHVAGLVRAKGMLMLGNAFAAEQAMQWGVIWSVVDDDALDNEAMNVARRLAGFDPEVVRRFKRVLNGLALGQFNDAIAAETRMQLELQERVPKRSSN